MLDFDKMNGLVPAIIQDADTAKVLMTLCDILSCLR